MAEKTDSEKIDEMYKDIQSLKGNSDMGLLSPFERIFSTLKDLPCQNPEAPCPKNGKKNSLVSAFMALSPIERIILAIVLLILGGGGSASIFQYLI